MTNVESYFKAIKVVHHDAQFIAGYSDVVSSIILWNNGKCNNSYKIISSVLISTAPKQDIASPKINMNFHDAPSN